MALSTTEVQLSTSDVNPEVLGSSHGVSESGLRHRNVTHQGDSDDEESSFMEQQPYSENERTWAGTLLVSCGVDVIASGIIFCTAMKYAYRDGGVSLYSMSMQTASHWISSVLLLLRLMGEVGASQQRSLLKHRRAQLHREQLLSIVMGIAMLISACALLFKAFRKIKFWQGWYEDMARRQMDEDVIEVTEWLAWVGFAVYVLQAMLRGIAVWKMNVALVQHALVASVVSLLYLFVLGLGASYQREWSWKAEPIAAIVLVFVTLIEGIRIIFYYLDDMDTRLRHDRRA